MASPDRFIPVTISSSLKKAVLVDAMVGYANPCQELLRESQDTFGKEAEISTIISIGSGKGDSKLSFDEEKYPVITVLLNRGLTNCEQVHEQLERRLKNTGAYYRFNVEKELIGQDDAILAHTSSYLSESVVSDRVDEATTSIQDRPKGILLKDISKCHLIYELSY